MEELKQTVQKGHTLLRKKEERLSQLENSLVEEVLVRTHTHTRDSASYPVSLHFLFRMTAISLSDNEVKRF